MDEGRREWPGESPYSTEPIVVRQRPRPRAWESQPQLGRARSESSAEHDPSISHNAAVEVASYPGSLLTQGRKIEPGINRACVKFYTLSCKS